MVTYTAKQKLDAVNRELRYRRKVYPRFVESGRLDKKEAEYQIAIFESIADDYRRAEESERLI